MDVNLRDFHEQNIETYNLESDEFKILLEYLNAELDCNVLYETFWLPDPDFCHIPL